MATDHDQVKENKSKNNFIAAGDLESYHEGKGASLQAPAYSPNNSSVAQKKPQGSANNQGGAGQGMSSPEGLLSQMSNAFGADFSNVNIHTSGDAHKKTSELGAQAYTTGSDIYFNKGFNPSSDSGKHLLAHELTHVVQQSKGRVKPTMEVGGQAINDSPALEKEADQMGSEAVQQLNAKNQSPAQLKSINPTEGPIQGFGIGNWLKKGIDAVGGAAKSVVSGAKKVVKGAGSAVSKAGSSMFGAIKNLAGGVKGAVSNVGSGLLGAAKSVGSGLFGGLKSMGSGLIGGIKNGLSGVKKGIGSFAGGAWEGIKSVGNGIRNGASQVVDGVRSGVPELLNDPLGGLGDILGGIKNGAMSVGGGLFNALKSTGKGFIQGLKDAANGTFSGLKSLGNGLWDGLKKIGGGLWEGVKKLGTGLKDGIIDALGGLLKAGYSIFDAVMELGPGMLENIIGPEGTEVDGEDIPVEHISMEYIAHHIAYSPDSLKDKTKSAPLVAAGYDVNNYKIRVGPNGFQAVLIFPDSEHPELNPILAFRGTLSFQGVSTDLDTQQVGHHQYMANEEEFNQLVNSTDGKVDVTGHSLGGAMAQLFTAKNPGKVGSLVTFQSPGISRKEAEEGNRRISELDVNDRPEISHHIVDNDLVDTAGEKNLTGTVYEHNIDSSMDPLTAHTSFIFHSPEFTEQRENLGITDDVVAAIGAEIRTSNADILKYDDHPNVVRRVIYEAVRKQIGYSSRGIRRYLREIGFEKLFSGPEYEDYDKTPSS